MQLGLPLRRDRPPDERDTLVVGSRNLPLRLVSHGRARRYILRVEPEGSVRVTIPRWGSRAGAKRFARQHLDWIRREQYRQLREPSGPRVWRAGTRILMRGRAVPLVLDPGPDHVTVRLGVDVVPVPRSVPILDETADLRPFIERHLRALASSEIVPRLRELAAAHGLRVARIQIRDQRSHWGSCSSKGTIALNWRLLQMPPSVSDYVLLHELMHLREPNHSRRFWRLVEQVCPAHREARVWLRTHQRLLR